MKRAVVLIGLILSVLTSFSQDGAVQNEPYEMNGTFGVGLGLDYGGLGGQLNIRLHSRAAIFGSIGYMVAGVGYNAGATFRVLPEEKICPTVTAMFGHNAAIYVENFDEANKTYFGPTIGVGAEWYLKRDSENYLAFHIWRPFRSSKYEDDLAALENNPDVKLTVKPTPVLISIGYHFVL